MKAEQLAELARLYDENRPFITNEEQAKMSLVVPFIRLLGYDPNRPKEVRLEYAADFTVGDGKKLPDRMDFAIFDQTGQRPLMVIETKPLGTDLRARAQQLARYLAQLPELRFGIMTDGCRYHFYGDLDRPNTMDAEPFFQFALDDTKADWGRIAAFLAKFSRESFNSETLVADAENSRYRSAMVDKLVRTLRDPAADDAFVKWLVDGIYDGSKTAKVLDRMKDLAREAIEPAMLRAVGDGMLEKLRNKIYAAERGEAVPAEETATSATPVVAAEAEDRKAGVITTRSELEFFEAVRMIASKAGFSGDKVLYKDTVNYFNVSYDKPTRWFIRYFGDSKRTNLTTLLSVERAQELAPGFEVEAAPSAFGQSRIYIDQVGQIWALQALVLESLKTLG
jgi:hypothetical protein